MLAELAWKLANDEDKWWTTMFRAKYGKRIIFYQKFLGRKELQWYGKELLVPENGLAGGRALMLEMNLLLIHRLILGFLKLVDDIPKLKEGADPIW